MEKIAAKPKDSIKPKTLAKLLSDVKIELLPGKDRQKDVSTVIKNINNALRSKKIKATAVCGGSFAKDTNLKDNFDVDLFVKFDVKSYTDKDISGLLEKALSNYKPVRVHGSRDYFQFKHLGLNLEVVPVLDVKNPKDAVNVTDMSPFHVKWVVDHIKKNSTIADEIRLTKKFCKAQGCYGAESYIKGFSGHVIDILVINYGGFVKLLEASVKWPTGKKKIVIDVVNAHKGNALFFMNSSKIANKLVVVDPVYPARNAAAALSDEKLEIFISEAKNFLKKPSEDFFVEHELTIEDIKKRFAVIKKDKKNAGSELFILKATQKEGKRDVVGSKLLKVLEIIQGVLTDNDFELIDSGWYWKDGSDALYYFVIKNSELDAKKIVQGPPVQNKFHADNFKKKHTKTFVRDQILFAEIERKFSLAKDVVVYALTLDSVLERTQRLSFV